MRAARALLVSTVVSAAVVTGASAAEARPVPDAPIYCGPGSTQHGATCTPVRRHTEPQSVGAWALAILGVGALVVLA